MSIAIVKERLLRLGVQNAQQEELALKEIMQEIALASLSRSGFFAKAAFQGGTCLRILYGLDRFSEDLNFLLFEEDRAFVWKKYLKKMEEDFALYGFTLSIKDRSSASESIKRAFIKDESIGFELEFMEIGGKSTRKMQIKLEVDVRPPAGSSYETKYLDFPLNYDLVTQDLESLFASKCHALLCREYVKGRDWYDFSWYVARQVIPNYKFLSSALNQVGPWQGKGFDVTKNWLATSLNEKISSISWDDAKADVERFLGDRARLSLRVWSSAFFKDRLKKLESYSL